LEVFFSSRFAQALSGATRKVSGGFSTARREMEKGIASGRCMSVPALSKKGIGAPRENTADEQNGCAFLKAVEPEIGPFTPCRSQSVYGHS
jgi:hypothetical protein